MAKEKKESSCAVKRKTSIGGQALIEGIMMRGPKKTAMAVRDPQGEIVFEESVNKASKRSKITKLPIIRGVFGFIDSMAMGYKCLMRSAELSGLEEAEAELQREKEEKNGRHSQKGNESSCKAVFVVIHVAEYSAYHKENYYGGGENERLRYRKGEDIRQLCEYESHRLADAFVEEVGKIG